MACLAQKRMIAVSTTSFVTTTRVFFVALAIIDVRHQIHAVADLSLAGSLAVKSVYQSPWANDDVGQVRRCERDTDCLLDFGRLSVCSSLFKVCVFCPIPKMCQQDYGQHCSSDFQCTKRPNLVCFMATCTCSHGAVFKNGDCELASTTRRSTTAVLTTKRTAVSTSLLTTRAKLDADEDRSGVTTASKVTTDSEKPSAGLATELKATALSSTSIGPDLVKSASTEISVPITSFTSELNEATHLVTIQAEVTNLPSSSYNKAVSKREAPTTLFNFATVVESVTTPTPKEGEKLNATQNSIATQITDATSKDFLQPAESTFTSVTPIPEATSPALPASYAAKTTDSTTNETSVFTTEVNQTSVTMWAVTENERPFHIADTGSPNEANISSWHPEESRTDEKPSANFSVSTTPTIRSTSAEEMNGPTTSTADEITTMANIVQEWIPGGLTRFYPATGADATMDIPEGYAETTTELSLTLTPNLRGSGNSTLENQWNRTTTSRLKGEQQTTALFPSSSAVDEKDNGRGTVTSITTSGVNIENLLYPMHQPGAHSNTDENFSTAAKQTNQPPTTFSPYISSASVQNEGSSLTAVARESIEEFLFPAKGETTTNFLQTDFSSDGIFEDNSTIDSLLYPLRTTTIRGAVNLVTPTNNGFSSRPDFPRITTSVADISHDDSTIDSLLYPFQTVPTDMTTDSSTEGAAIDEFLFPAQVGYTVQPSPNNPSVTEVSDDKSTNDSSSYQFPTTAADTAVISFATEASVEEFLLPARDVSSSNLPSATPSPQDISEDGSTIDSLLYPLQTKTETTTEPIFLPNNPFPEGAIEPFLYPIYDPVMSNGSANPSRSSTSSGPLPTAVSSTPSSFTKSTSEQMSGTVVVSTGSSVRTMFSTPSDGPSGANEADTTTNTGNNTGAGVDRSTQVTLPSISNTTVANDTAVTEVRTTSFRPPSTLMTRATTQAAGPVINQGTRRGRKVVFQLKGPQMAQNEDVSVTRPYSAPTSTTPLTQMPNTLPTVRSTASSEAGSVQGAYTIFPTTVGGAGVQGFEEDFETTTTAPHETPENWFNYWNHRINHPADSHHTPSTIDDTTESLRALTTTSEISTSTKFRTSTSRRITSSKKTSTSASSTRIFAIVLAAALSTTAVSATSAAPNEITSTESSSTSASPSTTRLTTSTTTSPSRSPIKPLLPIIPLIPPMLNKTKNNTSEQPLRTNQQTHAANLALTIMGTLAVVLMVLYIVYRSYSFKKRKTRTHIMRPTSKEALVKMETGWSDLPEVNYMSNAFCRLHRDDPDRVFYRRPQPPQKNRLLTAAKRRLPSLSQLVPAKLRSTNATTAVLHTATPAVVVTPSPVLDAPMVNQTPTDPEAPEESPGTQQPSRSVFVIPTPLVPVFGNITKKIREVTARPRSTSNGHIELTRSKSAGPGRPRRIEVKPWTGAELATARVLHHHQFQSPSRDSTSTTSSTAVSVTDTFDRLEPAYKPQNIRNLPLLPPPEDPSQRRSSLPALGRVEFGVTPRSSRLAPLSRIRQSMDPTFKFFPPSWRDVLPGDEALPLIADVIRTHENYLRRRKAGHQDGKKNSKKAFGVGM